MTSYPLGAWQINQERAWGEPHPSHTSHPTPPFTCSTPMSYVTLYTRQSRRAYASRSGAERRRRPRRRRLLTDPPGAKIAARRAVGRDMRTLGRHILGHLAAILGGLGRSGHGLVWPSIREDVSPPGRGHPHPQNNKFGFAHPDLEHGSDLRRLDWGLHHGRYSSRRSTIDDRLGTASALGALGPLLYTSRLLRPIRPTGQPTEPTNCDRRSTQVRPIDADRSPRLLSNPCCQLSACEVDGPTKLAPRRWISATETLVAQGFPVHPHFPRRSPHDFLCSFNRMIDSRQHRTVCSQSGNAMHVTVAGACNVIP